MIDPIKAARPHRCRDRPRHRAPSAITQWSADMVDCGLALQLRRLKRRTGCVAISFPPSSAAKYASSGSFRAGLHTGTGPPGAGAGEIRNMRWRVSTLQQMRKLRRLTRLELHLYMCLTAKFPHFAAAGAPARSERSDNGERDGCR